MATVEDPGEVFAVNIAAIAREVAMDILPVNEIMRLHQLDDFTWERITSTPKFQQMVVSMQSEWHSANNVRERTKVKAATGLEMQLEHYINDLADLDIPLTQRVEAGKFLAHLGELLGKDFLGGPGGNQFSITLNIGSTQVSADGSGKVIDGTAVRTAIPE